MCVCVCVCVCVCLSIFHTHIYVHLHKPYLDILFKIHEYYFEFVKCMYVCMYMLSSTMLIDPTPFTPIPAIESQTLIKSPGKFAKLVL
jgi:hypothetical protein